MAEQCGVRYYAGFAHRLLGESILKTNPTQAASHFEKSIAIFQKIKAENQLAMAYAGFGRLHKQQGETVRAREYLTKALEIFTQVYGSDHPSTLIVKGHLVKLKRRK